MPPRHFTTPIPLALYLHYPWCLQRCPYCDFNSYVGKIDDTGYCDQLIRDLDLNLPRIWGRRLRSIFIGGGTPSLLSPAALTVLLQQIRSRLNPLPTTEVTLEANPGTAEQGRFHGYRQAGVNRLSLGIQSFDDHQLQNLGRIHDRKQAFAAITMAQQAGFGAINLDLMFALPQQGVTAALDDLRQAIDFGVEHISWYQLTIEGDTPFAHKPPPHLPQDEQIWEIATAGSELLQQHGYHQYEVSAFAREGFECRHNRNYWQFGDYLGLGAGAHSKITHFETGVIAREWRQRHPRHYLEATTIEAFRQGSEELSREETIADFFLNALRLNEGVGRAIFEERTALRWEELTPLLTEAKTLGLLEPIEDSAIPTRLGRDHLDDLLQIFITSSG
ncbi:MAG: radical SAM family heme chaperone HemW [Gammaproteobacteria bacterium]|nr:radical SAM family heme chaperone HemW [Gammaproteobacteria bacterium]